MKKIGLVLLVLVLGLWFSSGTKAQKSVGSDEGTVRAQLTAVVHPALTATP